MVRSTQKGLQQCFDTNPTPQATWRTCACAESNTLMQCGEASMPVTWPVLQGLANASGGVTPLRQNPHTTVCNPHAVPCLLLRDLPCYVICTDVLMRYQQVCLIE